MSIVLLLFTKYSFIHSLTQQISFTACCVSEARNTAVKDEAKHTFKVNKLEIQGEVQYGDL